MQTTKINKSKDTVSQSKQLHHNNGGNNRCPQDRQQQQQAGRWRTQQALEHFKLQYK